MSKHNHNYSQYSNKNRENKQDYNKPVEKPIVKTPEVQPETKTAPVPEVVPVKPELVQETVKTVTLPDTLEGTVVNCTKLNIRENASVRSGIVCILNAMTEVRVDAKRTTNKWAYIYTDNGLEGYCMREYIDVDL